MGRKPKTRPEERTELERLQSENEVKLKGLSPVQYRTKSFG
ncbi:IS3-Spn1 transposase [Streptococcus pneumoniae]|nr:IS3-Spn1 transposase [Streptococcus pneumoniae]